MVKYKILKQGFKGSGLIFNTKAEAEREAKRWLPHVKHRIVKVKNPRRR